MRQAAHATGGTGSVSGAARRWAPRLAPLRAGEAARCAASTRSLPATASSKRSRGSRRAATATRFQASRALFFDLLGPLGRGRRQAGTGRDELLHDRLGARAGADLPGGALRARGARRARLGLLEGAPSARRSTTRPGVTDGIDWWVERLRLAEEGVRGLDDPAARGPDQPRRARLGRPRARLRRPAATSSSFDDEPAMREFFDLADERRRGPPRALARGPRPSRPGGRSEALRGGARASSSAEGYHCAAVLRRSYEQGAARV